MAFTKTYETLWADPGWHAEARAWIEERLDADGRELVVAWFNACLPFDDAVPLRPRRLIELCA